MLIKHCRWSGFVVKVQFHAKCTVLVLTCAVLAERLCSYNLQQCDTTPRTPLGELTALPQTSWVDFVERKGKEKGGKRNGGKEKGESGKKGRGKGSEMEKEGTGGEGDIGKRGRRKGNGKERGKREGGREEFYQPIRRPTASVRTLSIILFSQPAVKHGEI